jgi:hypothetical protein
MLRSSIAGMSGVGKTAVDRFLIADFSEFSVFAHAHPMRTLVNRCSQTARR